MASIRDVAQKAGVGVGTVSRVLNGNGYVKADTRKRIEAAIRELNYTPNELARNLFHNRTGIVGVLVPDVDHPFFAGYAKHVETALYEMGYKSLVGNTIGKSNREKEFLDMLDRNMVDGIITACHTLNADEYRSHKKTIVSLDREFGPEVPIIKSDHDRGGEVAARILLESGCKRVLNFSAESPGIVANRRHTILDQVLREHGVEVIDHVMEWNRFGHEDYRIEGERAYGEYEGVDGVFGTDQTVLYYVRRALQNGKRIPEDLKVVSYDGTYIVGLFNPELTYIYQDVKMLAELSANSVVDLIEARRPVPHEQVIPIRLHQGTSTLPTTISGISEI